MIHRSGRTLAIILGVVFLLSVGAGIYRDEIPDVVSRATIICYSCIGIK